MSMWRDIKRGFSFGIGWRASSLVWGWIMKIIGWIVLVIGAGVGLPMVADSVGTYNQVKQKYERQAHAKTEKPRPAKENGSP